MPRLALHDLARVLPASGRLILCTHRHPDPDGLGALLGVPILAVVDHHEGPRGTVSAPPVPFEWVDTRAFDLEPDERVATALFCGVRYDTNDLQRGASALDEQAFLRLEKRANRHLVAEIDQPPLPRAWFQQMHTALAACRTHGTLSLTLMDEVPSPEAVAEIADWLLRLEGQTWSLAGGACDGVYQVSLRTDQAGADAYPMLNTILDGLGSCGGHGRMAGGQVVLDRRPLAILRAEIAERTLRQFGLTGVAAEPIISPAAAHTVAPPAR